MKTVLVAGAAGGAGKGIVRALLSGGMRVIATSRRRERLEALRTSLDAATLDRFTPLVGNAGDFSGAVMLADAAWALGGADAAVAVLGRGVWTSGPLLTLPPQEWRAVLDEMLTSHFAFARAVVPRLLGKPDSLYLSIGGGAAFEPMPEAGLMSIAAAGQAMLTRVLARERQSAHVRIHELIINGALRTRDSQHVAEPGWISADDVGAVVAELVRSGTSTWPNVRVRGPLFVMDPLG
jgi:NAD(P)-dependent dehydrogenase (short-subunit alcohol dehydrogenase family)